MNNRLFMPLLGLLLFACNNTESGLRQPGITKSTNESDNTIDFSNIKSKKHLMEMLGNTIWYGYTPSDLDVVYVYLFSPNGDSISWRADPKGKRSLDQAIEASVGFLSPFSPDYDLVEDKGAYSMNYEKYRHKEVYTFVSEKEITL